MWGETGWGRLFSSSYGGQVAWLLPAALVMIVVLLWTSRRGGRSDLTRAAVLGWGGWLVVAAAVISFSAGIIHEYYTVALAPAIGALVGIGSVALWAHRSHLWARLVAAGLVAGSAWWSQVLLGRSADFVTWLGPAVLIGGVVVAVAILVPPYVPQRLRRGVALGAGTLSPAWWWSSRDRPLAPWRRRRARRRARCPLPGPRSPGIGGMGARGAGGPGMQGRAGGGPGGPGPGTLGQARVGLPPVELPGRDRRRCRWPPRRQHPSQAVTDALLADADQFTWVAAAVGANSAAGYQLATERPVMAIGGFNEVIRLRPSPSSRHGSGPGRSTTSSPAARASACRGGGSRRHRTSPTGWRRTSPRPRWTR